jgi:hypothetical protein
MNLTDHIKIKQDNEAVMVFQNDDLIAYYDFDSFKNKLDTIQYTLDWLERLGFANEQDYINMKQKKYEMSDGQLRFF